VATRVDAVLTSVAQRRHDARRPFLAAPFFCLLVSFSTERAATGGASAAATEKSTTVKHHHPIPRSHSRTVSSSTSRTTPYDRLTSGRARRACASTAAAIFAAKLSSRVAVLLGALTAFLLRCSRFASMCWCSRGRPFGVEPLLARRSRQARGRGRHCHCHPPSHGHSVN
jgi:hypothetical protein